MNKLIKLAVENNRIVLFFTVIIAAVGAYCFYLLPRQESPDVSAPAAMVITPYPGAAANDVKDLVTKKIEDELVELDGYDKCEGNSKESISVVVVYFHNGTDLDKAMQDVRNAVADVQDDLPTGCLASQVDTNLIETAGIIISLSGENYSYEQLASFGKQFENKLADINGVSKFKIKGDLDKEVKVDIETARLNQLGLSIEEVCQILQAQNIQIPSGSIDYGDTKITVSTPGIYKSVDEIKNTILSVSSTTGVVTKLGDIADIHMGVEEGVAKYKQNGQNAVLLTGYFQDNKNVVIIGKDVRKAIDEVKAQLPRDLTVQEVVYQPDEVSSSTNEFMLHLLIGILLVIVIVYLGMGLRNAMIVSTAIPLSILMTFGVMYLVGIQIHQLSLTALIISLGILVDNAIVVCDTIQTRINLGENNFDASCLGTQRCVVPIFTATLIIITAFSPLLGLPGAPGEFMSAVPLVLMTSVLASYVVAMFITPALAVQVCQPSDNPAEKESALKRFFDTLLEWSLKNKKTVLVGTFAALLAVVVFLMPLIPVELFPNVDKDSFYIDIDSEVAGNIDATEALTDQITALLSREPEIKSITVAIGGGMPKYYITTKPAPPSDDFAQMVCKFDLDAAHGKRFKTNAELAYYIQNLLDKKIAGGKCKVNLLAYAEPKDANVIVKISGSDLARLNQVSDQLQERIKKIPGTTNVRDDMKDETFQLEVKLDEDKASSLGITKYDVQKQINTALYGSDASVYRRNGEEYNIRVKSDIKNVGLLGNMMIKSSITGGKVPLHEFATVGVSSKIDTIKTFKRKITVTILVDQLPGYNAADMSNKIEREVVPKVDTSGTTITYEGTREDIKKNFTTVGTLSFVSLVLIYGMLLVQFKSFIKPLIILLTVPLSLIGSVLGLLILRQPLSLTAFLGIIALIGLVVKNGILLIDYINEARNQGLSIDEACQDGVDKRYNAIILSALTVIFALIPLAVSGSVLFAPMAVSLMFGLAVSTFLTMVVIPVVYSVIETALESRMRYDLCLQQPSDA